MDIFEIFMIFAWILRNFVTKGLFQVTFEMRQEVIVDRETCFCLVQTFGKNQTFYSV